RGLHCVYSSAFAPGSPFPPPTALRCPDYRTTTLLQSTIIRSDLPYLPLPPPHPRHPPYLPSLGSAPGTPPSPCRSFPMHSYHWRRI
ncbi:hypothetical protein PENTCL1PPCAC_27862, partial [Pristionchus entomophagus]